LEQNYRITIKALPSGLAFSQALGLLAKLSHCSTGEMLHRLQNLPYIYAYTAPRASAELFEKTFTRLGVTLELDPPLSPVLPDPNPHNPPLGLEASTEAIHPAEKPEKNFSSPIRSWSDPEAPNLAQTPFTTKKLTSKASLIALSGIALTFSLALLVSYHLITSYYFLPPGKASLPEPKNLENLHNRSERRWERIIRGAQSRHWKGQYITGDWDTKLEEAPNFYNSPEAQALEQELLQTLKVHPKDLPTLLSLGKMSFEKRRLENAGNYFQAAFKVDPKSSESAAWLGKTLWQRGEYDTAAYYFKKALYLDSNNHQLLLSLGNLHYYYRLDTLRAVNYYKAFLSRSTNSSIERALVKENLIRWFFNQNKLITLKPKLSFENFESNRLVLEKEFKSQPLYQTANALGMLFLQQDKALESQFFFEKSLTLEPKQSLAYAALAYVYSTQERTAACNNLFKRAYQNESVSGNFLKNYAFYARWYMEDKDLAKKIARRYLNQPQSPENEYMNSLAH